MRDKHDEGIKEKKDQNYSLQSCRNFTLEPELELTVTASLAGRDAQEVLYTGFVDSKQLWFLPDIGYANIHKTAFFDDVRPKVLCIHKKLIVDHCLRLQAVKKRERLLVV